MTYLKNGKKFDYIKRFYINSRLKLLMYDLAKDNIHGYTYKQL